MPFATLLHLVAGLFAIAEDDKNAFTPINAERPGFTNPPSTVQKGRFIIEYGYRQTQGDDLTIMDHGDGAAIRYGVSDRFEARLFLPSYFTMIDPTGRTVGLGDSGFGVKYFLAPARGKFVPSLGITLDTSIISGSTAFRAARWQPTLRLAAEWDFDEDHTFGMNLLYGQPQGNGTDKFDQLAISGCYSWNVGRWQPFVEL